MKRFVTYVTVLYLVLLVVVAGFMYFDDGSLWPVTLFLFSPRWVTALPLVVLIPMALFVRPRLTLLFVLHGLLIFFPICGFRWSPTADKSGDAKTLKVLTCNLGAGPISQDQLVALIRAHKVQVALFQESPWATAAPVFEQLGWTHRQEGNVSIGSEFGLGDTTVLARQPPSHYNAVAGVSCDVQLTSLETNAAGNLAAAPVVQLVCVHLPTFRPAFEMARHLDFNAGAEIEEIGAKYCEIAARIITQAQASTVPTLIAGDFNAPVESAYYRDSWNDYQNAFSNTGFGFGYSKYTKLHGIRIDHVLVDQEWEVHSAVVGPGLGGDHCPVIVEVQLKDQP